MILCGPKDFQLDNLIRPLFEDIKQESFTDQFLMLSQQADWCIMVDISKIRINNSMVPNFVNERRSYLVTKATQNLGKIG